MARYQPENPPQAIDPALGAYIYRELQRIGNAFLTVDALRLLELHVEPPKPRDGDVILADGTDFDPGSGAGYYGRVAGVWTFLGNTGGTGDPHFVSDDITHSTHSPSALPSATGLRAIAVADDAVAGGIDGLALGVGASAAGLRGIAVGNTADASVQDAIAIGLGAEGKGTLGVAIGPATLVETTAQQGIAIGWRANALSGALDGIAIGNATRVRDTKAIAIGSGADSRAENSIAIGKTTIAQEADCIVIGILATTLQFAQDSIAIGKNAVVNSRCFGSIAIGVDARIRSSGAGIDNGHNAIAIGNDVAVGGFGNLGAVSTILIGSFDGATGASDLVGPRGSYPYGIGIGTGVKVDGTHSICIGSFAESDDPGTSDPAPDDAIVIGHGAFVDIPKAIAIGLNANVNSPGDKSVAIGADSFANVDEIVSFNGLTGAVIVPDGTTAQQPAVDGAIRYNSQNSKLEGRQGGSWFNLDGT